MRKSLLALLVLMVILAIPADAFAAYGYVRNTFGATGVYSQAHVLNRFTGSTNLEGYFVAMVNSNHYRDDGHAVQLSWEIYEYSDNVWYPVVHIYYDEPDSSYANDEYYWWYTSEPSLIVKNDWNSMQIAQTVRNSSSYWNCSIGGNVKAQFWWPYPTSNYTLTSVETYKNGILQPLDSSDYFYMGHQKYIQVQMGSGSWLSQTSGNFNGYIYSGTDSAPPYYINYLAQYNDWECRR